MIVFTEIKRCQLPHFTHFWNFFQKGKNERTTGMDSLRRSGGRQPWPSVVAAPSDRDLLAFLPGDGRQYDLCLPRCGAAAPPLAQRYAGVRRGGTTGKLNRKIKWQIKSNLNQAHWISGTRQIIFAKFFWNFLFPSNPFLALKFPGLSQNSTISGQILLNFHRLLV